MTFCQVQETDCSVYGDRAGGLKAQMEKFQTFFGLHLSPLVFNEVEILSTGIQGKQASAQDAFSAAEVATISLTRQRYDEEFNSFSSTLLGKRHEVITNEPTLPRARRS